MDDFDSKPFFSSVSNLALSPICEHGIFGFPQDAKRSALHGGPCVALTQPLPRALVKYELLRCDASWLTVAATDLPTRSFNWRGLLKTLCRYWLIRQAHEQYFQTYFGRPQ